MITTLRLVPLGSTIALRLSDAIKDGCVQDNPRLEASAGDMLEELVRLVQALRPMREAMHDTTPAGQIPGSYVRTLAPQDAGEVMVLQRCCWVDEALDNATLDLAPLHEGLEDVRRWLAEWPTTGMWLDGRLIGMVRTRSRGSTGHIGRLAVVPDLRGSGIGRWLLRHAEAALEAGCDRVELSTAFRSTRNIRLYTSEGFMQETASDAGTARLSKPLRGSRAMHHEGRLISPRR